MDRQSARTKAPYLAKRLGLSVQYLAKLVIAPVLCRHCSQSLVSHAVRVALVALATGCTRRVTPDLVLVT